MKTEKQVTTLTDAFEVAFRLAGEVDFDCYSEMKHAFVRALGPLSGIVDHQRAAHDIEQVLLRTFLRKGAA